jgi:hypothetical protein
LSIVHDADQRPMLGDVGEEGQRRQPEQESVWHNAYMKAEHSFECFALRLRQPFEVIEHWQADLMKAAIGEFRLRFDAAGLGDIPVLTQAVRQIPEERALADSCLSSEHDDPAPTS